MNCANCGWPVDLVTNSEPSHEVHQTPCVFCSSDGHSSCQHVFEDWEMDEYAPRVHVLPPTASGPATN